MSAGLTRAQRDGLARLFDVLVPAAGGMPAASEAGVAGAMLDHVLDFRPDLRVDLLRVLRASEGQDAQAFVRALEASDPEGFAALGLAAAHGYYASPSVRAILGYHGQQRQPFDPDEVPEYAEQGLLQRVIDRGPIWRDPGEGAR